MSADQEILRLLFEHADKPMDFVAIFMFLNTGPVGAYEDRFGDDVVRLSLSRLLQRGYIRAWLEETGECFSDVQWGAVPCRLALTPEGQSALLA